MDINLLGLIGSLIRLIFIYKFNYKKQNEESAKNFEKEEKKDILIGSITMIAIIVVGLSITFFGI
jgi:heme/copper-type cytochrome/quinol oxidase subunit 2